MTRVVFLGTPSAAIPTLAHLTSLADVVAVITQPDRPRGRSSRPRPSPVKESAAESGLRVLQPGSTTDLMTDLASLGPVDLGIVVAYGRLLTKSMLEVPGHGFLNVHFSLLPRWRGAAPVARAIMADDRMTGVTIIKLDEGLDTGPVISAQAVDIKDGEIAGDLTARLAQTGANLLRSVVSGYLEGIITPVPQTDDGVTYAHKLTAEDRPLSPLGSAVAFVAKVRALSPRPGATLSIDGVVHKIISAVRSDTTIDEGWSNLDGRLLVGVSDGAVEIVTIQPPGKTAMTGSNWLLGRRGVSGKVE